ncbi:FAD-dependent oxidoreductase [Stieleria varia]|uniref:Ribulose-1,5-biphosphate synthetase n=1 Tax=Stieleria varia TaxID=2528005 RepID=A0A5C5ZWZ9_9BACT|nr:FAD-dependent oxidoreductase [Stieleria varia]TWT91561.1 ribulose-1,5-biphosphate synthetase [Stieleria varia]
MPITRRQLLTSSMAAPAAMAVACAGEAHDASRDDIVSEAAREVPVVDSVDVLVCGGGPAGISAAISAAKCGASVRILEAHGCLGGVWTSGMLSYIMDARKPGLNTELVKRLESMSGYRFVEHQHYMYDVEAMKVLLEDWCGELGIRMQYHTRVVAVDLDQGNRVRGVVTESKSGRQAWRAKTVIDTTGDGDVGALAGCSFEIGRDSDCPCQPMSLMAVITASPEALRSVDTGSNRGNKDKFLKIMRSAGLDPSYSKPTVWHLGGAVAAVMLNHEYNVKAFDADAVTQATIRARRELYDISKALHQLGGPWEGCRLVTTAEQIGVRDGRRIKGRYFVDVSDVMGGVRHEDAVCRSTFSVDIHALSREQNKTSAYSSEGVKAKPFDIPLRALIAQEVDGLMMAGRCISGDFFAHASYRVTGNAVAMGEAAGVCASIAASKMILPHEVAWNEVGPKLGELRETKNNGE